MTPLATKIILRLFFLQNNHGVSLYQYDITAKSGSVAVNIRLYKNFNLHQENLCASIS
jgi:hypothetical protein